MRRRRGIILCLLGLLPLTAAALWAASGYERLSKAEKTVRVQVRDGLMGDITTRYERIRGPILGYYVGLLDGVGGAAAVALLGAAATLWLTRRRFAAEKEMEHAA